MAQSDDIARLTAIVVRQHQGALAERMRQTRGLSASQVGKACGTSAEIIYAWEQGLSMPTTQEALAWLTVLYEQAGPPGTGLARSQAEQAGRVAAQQAGEAKRKADIEAGW